MTINFKRLWHQITLATVITVIAVVILKESENPLFEEIKTPLVVLIVLCGLLMIPGLMGLRLKIENGKITAWRQN